MKWNDIPALVISDVDGTLLDHKDTVTEGLTRLRDLIKEKQVPFTLASGRCYEGLQDLIEYLGVSLPVVVNNGAGVMTGEKICWQKQIRPEDVRKAIEFADSLGMFVSVCSAREEWVFRRNAYVATWEERYGKKYRYLAAEGEVLTDRRWETLDIQKILVIDCDRNGRIKEVIRNLQTEKFSIVCYDERSADIMPAGCSKENGIAVLSGLLGTGTDRILAVGDSENDIQMLRSVGMGYAVANATDSLKEAADAVCTLAGAAGVAELVARYYGSADPGKERV